MNFRESEFVSPVSHRFKNQGRSKTSVSKAVDAKSTVKVIAAFHHLQNRAKSLETERNEALRESDDLRKRILVGKNIRELERISHDTNAIGLRTVEAATRDVKEQFYALKTKLGSIIEQNSSSEQDVASLQALLTASRNNIAELKENESKLKKESIFFQEELLKITRRYENLRQQAKLSSLKTRDNNFSADIMELEKAIIGTNKATDRVHERSKALVEYAHLMTKINGDMIAMIAAKDAKVRFLAAATGLTAPRYLWPRDIRYSHVLDLINSLEEDDGEKSSTDDIRERDEEGEVLVHPGCASDDNEDSTGGGGSSLVKAGHSGDHPVKMKRAVSPGIFYSPPASDDDVGIIASLSNLSPPPSSAWDDAYMYKCETNEDDSDFDRPSHRSVRSQLSVERDQDIAAGDDFDSHRVLSDRVTRRDKTSLLKASMGHPRRRVGQLSTRRPASMHASHIERRSRDESPIAESEIITRQPTASRTRVSNRGVSAEKTYAFDDTHLPHTVSRRAQAVVVRKRPSSANSVSKPQPRYQQQLRRAFDFYATFKPGSRRRVILEPAEQAVRSSFTYPAYSTSPTASSRRNGEWVSSSPSVAMRGSLERKHDRLSAEYQDFIDTTSPRRPKPQTETQVPFIPTGDNFEIGLQKTAVGGHAVGVLVSEHHTPHSVESKEADYDEEYALVGLGTEGSFNMFANTSIARRRARHQLVVDAGAELRAHVPRFK